MDKVLELVFRNAGGSEVTISLPNPKDDLTEYFGSREPLCRRN